MKRERLLSSAHSPRRVLRPRVVLWFVLPVDPVVVSTFAASQDASAAPASEAQLATVKQYCVTCHNDRAKTGGVSFEGLTPEAIGQHADVFEKAVRKLRGRVMPPPGARQPGCPRRGLSGRLARKFARPRGSRRSVASVGPGRLASAQSEGIRQRGARSPGGRD